MNHPELLSENLSAGYDGQPILSNVSIKIPQNKISVILGANGCGKSTLLKTFARLLKPEGGTITLDGKNISSIPSRQIAQKLGLLPQSPIVPEGIKVTDLVARGRFPYRRAFGGLSTEDFQELLPWQIAAWMSFPEDSASLSGCHWLLPSRQTFCC